jgi:hypothetical protein
MDTGDDTDVPFEEPGGEGSLTALPCVQFVAVVIGV